MNRKTKIVNRQSRRAFTLIELLVVIAIIAILAAILFPVFAQAKAAAKATVSLSNMKQLGTSMAIYSSDADDMRVPKNNQDIAYNADGSFNKVVNEYSWRQLLQPYTKSQDIFKDPVNSAAKWPDDHTWPAARSFNGWTPVTVASNLAMNRGYYWANVFNGGDGFDKAGSMTGWADPAGMMNIIEGKDFGSYMGPYETWTQNVDSQTSYYGAGNETTGLQWNWGSDKYGGKAMVVNFGDTHAKRLVFSTMCGNSFMKKASGSTDVDNWGMGYAQQAGYSWANGMCDTLPTQFK